MATVVKLTDVRLSYPQLFEAVIPKGSKKAKFSAAFHIPYEHPAVKEIEKAMQAEATAKWSTKAKGMYTQLKAGDKVALHDGAAKSLDGLYYLNASNETRPTVLDKDAKTYLTRETGKPYAGCYVDAVIEIWAQDNDFGKRINASLMGVMFRRDGEPLAGGRVASTDDFVPIADDAKAEAKSAEDVWN